MRRGHELGAKQPGWRFPSAQWVQQCERLVELDGELDAILRGEARPKDAPETIEFALLCQLYKHRNAAAAQFYEEAFASEPKLASDMNAQHRYNAACAAALAGSGQGKDAASLDDAERACLRRQALEWLQADLAFWKEQLDSASRDENAESTAKLRGAVLGTLRHWQQDKDLAGVRDEAAVSKLPDAESEAWATLWAQVNELVDKPRNDGDQ